MSNRRRLIMSGKKRYMARNIIKAMIFDLDEMPSITFPHSLEPSRRSIEPFMKRNINGEEIVSTFNQVVGTVDIIRELKNKGILIAMLTRKERKSADITLKQLGIADLFEWIETGSIREDRKCEEISCILEHFNIKTEEAFYIGNEQNDIENVTQMGEEIISNECRDIINLGNLKSLKPYKRMEYALLYKKLHCYIRI
jgi:3-deoxy-D-manno-octulosonate 8-phosphate phosphatase KdsC-like HAD superfamily phosphatase